MKEPDIIFPFSGLHVWRVKYDWRFSSSSDSVDHENETGLFVTIGDSLEDVQEAIAASIGPQAAVSKLHSAEFLGKTS